MDNHKIKFEKGIIYLCIHKKLNECVGADRVMEKRIFFTLLGRQYHLPKSVHAMILKEMEQLNMIEDLGTTKNYNIKILPLLTDPEENINKFYKQLGFF